MSEKQTVNIPKLTLADLDPKWSARVRSALLEGGNRIGVGSDGSIQVSNRYGEFMPLLLPASATQFVSIEEAQKAIDLLGVAQTGLVPIVKEDLTQPAPSLQESGQETLAPG